MSDVSNLSDFLMQTEAPTCAEMLVIIASNMTKTANTLIKV